MRRPLSAPQASGLIDCARASSQAAPVKAGGVSANSGLGAPGDSAIVPASKAMQVAAPRNHSVEPIRAPRSGAQSISAALCCQVWNFVGTGAATAARPNESVAVPPLSIRSWSLRKNKRGHSSLENVCRRPPGNRFPVEDEP